MTQKPLFVNFSEQKALIGEIRRKSAFYDRSNTLGGHSHFFHCHSQFLPTLLVIARRAESTAWQSPCQ